MPNDKPRYYLYCEACDFQQDVAKILPRTPFNTVDELRTEAHRFHCSVCKSKHIVIREESEIKCS